MSFKKKRFMKAISMPIFDQLTEATVAGNNISVNNFLVQWLKVCFLFLMCCNTVLLLVLMKRAKAEESRAPKSHQLYVNLTRGRTWRNKIKFKKKGDCVAVAEVVQLKSVIRSNPWIKWEEGKVFWAAMVESLHPAAGASAKQHIREMSFNSWRVNE